jgi:hypothetical protein
MKSFFAAMIVVLLVASSASADWAYVAPGPVVYTDYYWPGAPVYAGTPVYGYPTPVVVARPIVAAPPAYYAPAPVVYGYPYVVRPRVIVPGQPVRNVLRATFP